MLNIRPNYKPDYVLGHLKDLANRLENIEIGTNVDVFNAYHGWVNTALRVLGPALNSEALDLLVTTRRYWALLAVDPGAAGTELTNLIRVEVQERKDAFKVSADELANWIERFEPNGSMAVLDTVVLMRHGTELQGLDWHGLLNERPDVPITVWIPLVAVDELDSLKRDRGEMVLGENVFPRRNLARNALAAIGTMFAGSALKNGHALRREDIFDRVSFRLQVEDLGHVRLPTGDAEITSVAQSLVPFAARMSLVTYDNAMAFRSRAIGLNAVLMPEPEYPEKKK